MSNYKRLGDFIQQVKVKNSDLKVDNLLGVSITKEFIPSIANTIGTDMSNYKIIKKNQFAYGPVTSRNGDKISIALLEDNEAIVSTSYTVFEVIDTEKLLSKYLMMWFRREEFDRYARYMSHGSTREVFSWEEMCEVQIPIPSLPKQKEIIKEYETITNRIKLNEQLTQKLEFTAQTIYKEWFVNFEFPNKEGKPYKSSGGKMVYNDELDMEVPEGWEVNNLKNISTIKGGKRLPKGKSLISKITQYPYIKVANLGKSKRVVLNQNFEYLTEDIQNKIAKYIVTQNDVIVSIVGTIGIVKIVDSSLNNANLTENCVKITNLHKINSDYLYYCLNSPCGKREMETRTVGGVQGKLPMYNIESLKILCPQKKVLDKFDNIIYYSNLFIQSLQYENIHLAKLKDLILKININYGETA